MNCNRIHAELLNEMRDVSAEEITYTIALFRTPNCTQLDDSIMA